MDIETRLSNLENLVFSLAETLNRNKFYGDADTTGVRQGISEITPYEATEIVYYGEKSKNFYDVPQGNITIFWDNYSGDYSVQRFEDKITVSFDTLTVATATISIMVQ